MFCARHAEEIASVSMEAPVVEDLGNGLFRITVDVVNSAVMPSRSAMAAQNEIGTPDRVVIQGKGLQVLVGGTLSSRNRYRPERLKAMVRNPATVLLEGGVPGQGRALVSWLVRGSGKFTVEYTAQKAENSAAEGELGS
jgi:hypothetical protein